MNNKTFSRGKIGSHQKLNREAIGKALHKHNKKRFAWPPITEDESMGYEALTNDTRDVEGLDDENLKHLKGEIK